MSVFKRTYRRYTGPISGERTRFWVLAKYAAEDLWSSRITNVLFVLCLVPALFSLLFIYIMNNEAVRLLLSSGHSASTPPIAIDELFFYWVLHGQSWPALVLMAWIGPKIITGDIANDALPIILSHPISRLEYVTAKIFVLAGFLISVTFLPDLFLFVFQSYISPVPWAASHLFILGGMFLSSVIWIALLSLLAVALASWVKWRIVATGLLFAAVFVPAGVGSVFNAVMRTQWGDMINVPVIMSTLWRHSLHVKPVHFYAAAELPVTACLLSLVAIFGICIAALNARIRAREVVRG